MTNIKSAACSLLPNLMCTRNWKQNFYGYKDGDDDDMEGGIYDDDDDENLICEVESIAI